MDIKEAGKIKEKLGNLFKKHGGNYGCLNPSCTSSNPIGSHSVSKCFLKEIEESGHILIFDRNDENVDSYIREPVSKASKFRGFCSDCDNRLFESFEKHPLQLSNDHLFRLSFRSVAKEYHTKRSAVDFYHTEIPREFINPIHIGQEQRRLEVFTRYFESMSEALLNESFNVIHSWVFVFEGSPLWLSSSIMMPDILPSNRRLKIHHWQPFTVDWVPYDGCHCCVVSYLTSQAQKPKRFCQFFSGMNPSKVCLAMLMMTLDNIENIFFRSSFTESLSDFERKYIHDLFFAFTEPNTLLKYPIFEKFPHFKNLPQLKSVHKI